MGESPFDFLAGRCCSKSDSEDKLLFLLGDSLGVADLRTEVERDGVGCSGGGGTLLAGPYIASILLVRESEILTTETGSVP